ncbi:P-loop NTPase fold protein [Amycolatopsis sp. YIM 10]|uniref:P-loop NTPase fold protein n=1 Tax=Amycolatopsis sp. YIM 10 TaxID=2653857 RepID=UPI00128FCEE2|nr:P-loop NTPase fold protein [Amycolatopsis sp. YIM 10]QFU89325.1 KAP family P-loop domain protein [Amycolatopsis sp. YIM 10]
MDTAPDAPPILPEAAGPPAEALPPKRGSAGAGLTIALVSGPVYRHPWFEDAVDAAVDDALTSWGTMAAGLVLQRAPAARVLNCSMSDQDTITDGQMLASLAKARAANADLIVIGFGGEPADAPSLTFTKVVGTIEGLVLAAAGSNGTADRPDHPANVPGVVAVGGLVHDREEGWKRSPFSSPGEIYAPCVDLLTTTVGENGPGFARLGGTMMATALVAGEIAATMTRLRVSAGEALERLKRLPPEVFLEAHEGNAAGPPPISAEPVALAGPTAGVNDYWTTTDRLGYQLHADALASLILDEGTKPPLTVAVKGEWGTGKTSLLRMTQARIDPLLDSGERRAIRLTRTSHGKLDRVSSGAPRLATVFKLLRRAEVREVVRDKPSSFGTRLRTTELRAESTGRWRPTVWFNPWMYQTGEQVWAGLAHEIINQVTQRLPLIDRERFWLALNLSRLDRVAVRGRVLRTVLARLLPALATSVLALVAGGVLLASGNAGWGAGVASAGVLGVVFRTVRLLWSRTDAVLPGLVTPPGFAGVVTGIAGGIADSVDDPRYRSRAGFLHMVHNDVAAVLDLVATRDRPLVVFVDDLDRCTSGAVIQLVEALNLFLAGQFPNCVFVVAMEPEVVAARLDAAYEPSGSGHSTGWRFLDKLVQLEFSLPAPDAAAMQGYISTTLTGSEAGEPTGPGSVSEEAVRAAQRVLGSMGSVHDVADRARAIEGPGTDERSPVLWEAAKRETLRRLTGDDPEVRAILATISAHLGRNPREIKRVINLIRFHSVINLGAAQRGGHTPLSIYQLTKLALIAVRWPHLRSVLAGQAGRPGTIVLTAAEDTLRGAQGGSIRDRLVGQGVDAASAAVLGANADLLRLLADNPPIGPGAVRHL